VSRDHALKNVMAQYETREAIPTTAQIGDHFQHSETW